MASKGLINEIVDVKAVKSQIDYLKTELDAINEKFGIYASAISEVNARIKSSKGMEELNKNLKENAGLIETAVKASQRQVSVTAQLTKVENELAALNNGSAEGYKKLIVKKKELSDLQKTLAQQAIQQTTEGTNIVASIEEQISASKRQVDSIKAIGDENKKLRAIRDSLDTNTQTAEIESLNQKIDSNTEILKANTDATIRQKMNIGNYKSAVEDLQNVLTEISADLKRMADAGQEGSAEFKNLQDKADKTRAQIDTLSGSIQKLGEKELTLKGQVKAMREELAQMTIDGKKGSAEYVILADKASKLQGVLSDVNDEIKNGARDNLLFKGISNALSGLAGGLEAGMGAWGLAIGKSEEFEVVMQKVASAIAIANGLEQLSAMIAKESAAKKLAVKAAELIGYNSVMGAQTLSVAMTNAEALAGARLSAGKKVLIALQWAWNKALMQNPLVLFIALLLAAGAGVYYLGKAFGLWGDNNEKAKEQLAEMTKQVDLQTKANARYLEILKARGATEAQLLNESIALSKQDLAAKEDLFTKASKLYGKDDDEYKAALDSKTAATEKFQDALLSAEKHIDEVLSAGSRTKNVEKFGEKKVKVDELTASYEENKKILEKLNTETKKVTEGGISFYVKIISDEDLPGKQKALQEAYMQSIEDAIKEGKKKEEDAAKQKQSSLEANAKKQQDLQRKIEDSKLNLITDANKRDLAELEAKYSREIEDIKGNGVLEIALRKQLETEKIAAVKKMQKDQADQAKTDTLKLEQEKIQLQMDALEEGTPAYLNKKIEAINKEREIAIAEAVKTKQDIGAINAAYDKKIADASLNELTQYLDKTSQHRLNATSKAQMDEEQQLLDQYKSGLITREQFDSGKLAIADKYNKLLLEAAVKNAEDIINVLKAAGIDTTSAEQALYDAKKALHDADVENFSASQDVKIEKQKEANDKLLELAGDLNSAVSGMVSNAFEEQFQNIDLASKKDEEAKKAELERAGSNDALKTAINKKYDAREAVREKQRQALELQKAKFEKISALFAIALNTAMGVTNAMSKVVTIPLVPFIIATGVLQAAVVATRPLPKYFKGREGGPAEWAIVGDKGREAIQFPSGKTMFTPDHATMTYLPAGANVIPNKDLLAMSEAISFTRVPEYTPGISALDIKKLQGEIATLHDDFNMLALVFKNKTEHHVNITERGIWHAAKNGESYQKWLNDNIRF